MEFELEDPLQVTWPETTEAVTVVLLLVGIDTDELEYLRVQVTDPLKLLA